jgi:hypothetical protein
MYRRQRFKPEALNKGIIALTAALLILVLVAASSIMSYYKMDIFPQKNKGLLGVTAAVTAQNEDGTENLTIPLAKSWNLITIPCNWDLTHIFTVFKPVYGNYVSTHTYQANETSDPWKSFRPDLPTSLIQDLDFYDYKYAYFVKLTDATQLNLTDCPVPENKTLELLIGWNLISYLSDTEQPVDQALSSISGKYSIVYSYNATTGGWSQYNATAPINNLTTMQPFRGYWINMTDDATLVYS